MQANKALLSLVVGLGFLIIAGAIIIAFGIYKKSTDPSFRFFAASKGPTETLVAPIAGPMAGGPIALPPGAEISHMEAAGNRLILHVRKKDGTQSIMVIDLDTGAVVRRLAIGRGP